MKIEFINFTYSNSTNILLENINKKIDEKCVVIHGRNGIGKSSLLKCIIKTESYEGNILIDGEENYNNLFSYMHQDDMLFSNLSVIENFKLLKIKNYRSLLKKFNVTHLIKSKIKYLSGGESRIIYFICIILKQSKYLILDEPLNHISQKNQKVLLKIIENDIRDKIIITHSQIEYGTHYKINNRRIDDI